MIPVCELTEKCFNRIGQLGNITPVSTVEKNSCRRTARLNRHGEIMQFLEKQKAEEVQARKESRQELIRKKEESEKKKEARHEAKLEVAQQLVDTMKMLIASERGRKRKHNSSSKRNSSSDDG